MDEELPPHEIKQEQFSLDARLLVAVGLAGAASSGLDMLSGVKLGLDPIFLGGVVFISGVTHYATRLKRQTYRLANYARSAKAFAYGALASGTYALAHEIAESIMN